MPSFFQQEIELYGTTWWCISEFPVSGVSCDQTMEGITPLPNSVGQLTNNILVFELVFELVFQLSFQLVIGSIF